MYIVERHQAQSVTTLQGNPPDNPSATRTMPYRLNPDRALPTALTRVARGEIHRAIGELESLPEDEAVHQVRKRCKKMRALLRLVRYTADGLYRYENAQYRTLANTLAGSRDAVSLRDALRKLAPGEFPNIEAFLSQRANHKSDEQALEDAAEQLAQAAQRIDAWQLQSLSWKDARKGYQKGYQRARKSMQEAFAQETAPAFHDFRKRVKDHWYHTRLLAKRHKKKVGARRKALRLLATALGDWRDLYLLCHFLAPMSDQFPGELIALLDRANTRSNQLHRQIEKLARDLLGPKRIAI